MFCDGGFVSGVGAGAVVFVSLHQDAAGTVSSLIGAQGLHIQPAYSAFHAEVSALDAAVQILLRISKSMRRIAYVPPAKHTRFS